MAKIKHYSRKWLNKDSGVAAIECNLESNAYMPGFEGTITLSDCSRRINLDFSVYDVKDLDKRIAKLNLLLEEISVFRDVYLQHYDEVKEDMVKRELERKKSAKKVKDKKDEL